MRNAVLYTKTPLEEEKCLERIKALYGGAKGSEKVIAKGKPPKSLYIWFPSTDLSDPVERMDMSDDIDRIPFENPYFTHIDFHLPSMLQNVVGAIHHLYPEMIVWTDDDRFYTSEEFIKAEF